MNTATLTHATSNNSAWRAILPAGFFSGLADFFYATIGAFLRDAPLIGPWKGVASGLLGKAAREGGIETAALGVALHFFITFTAAAMLYFIVKRIAWLQRQWLVLAVLYGVVFLAVMNYVVLPLSAIGHPVYALDIMPSTVFWHVVLVGLPTAWFISRGLKREANAIR